MDGATPERTISSTIGSKVLIYKVACTSLATVPGTRSTTAHATFQLHTVPGTLYDMTCTWVPDTARLPGIFTATVLLFG